MEIELFNYNGVEVRTVTVEGEPWFVASDVARILGYGDPRNAVNRHVDDDDRAKHPVVDSRGRKQPNAFIVNGSGLYALIFGSKLPAAKDFKRWVTSEVLPSIRKHGGYLRPDADAVMLTLEQAKAMASVMAEIDRMIAKADAHNAN